MHLIKMKFGGSFDPESVNRPNDNDVMWDVTFQGDYLVVNNVIDWCKLNLKDGQVKPSYLGALERADPHSFIAKSLLRAFKEPMV